MLKGRLVDRDGLPLAARDVFPRLVDSKLDSLYWSLHQFEYPRTDKEGRFCLPGLVADVPLKSLNF